MSYTLTSAQIWLFYVSESHVLVSVQAEGGQWTPDTSLGNWSTAVDAQSLSFCFLPGIGVYNTSNINRALLLYENSTGQVSALLQLFQYTTPQQTQWVDITSQESRSLPNEFKLRDPGGSTTLTESQPNAKFSAPFVSAANFSKNAVGALFSSPNDTITEVIYNVSTSGPGLFSGMNSHPDIPSSHL